MDADEPWVLTKREAIRLIEGCPRLDIGGISVPLTKLMGRINKTLLTATGTPAGY